MWSYNSRTLARVTPSAVSDEGLGLEWRKQSVGKDAEQSHRANATSTRLVKAGNLLPQSLDGDD